MTAVRTFHLRGLATVHLDTTDNMQPALEITLDPEYQGDLRDVACGPGDLYLSCNHVSALNNPALARFMERMEHWDWDGDDVPDCDEVADAIEDALYQTSEEPDVFHRPNTGWYARAVMSIVPPPPVRHIVFSFGKLQQRFRWYHYAAAIPTLAAFIALMQVQTHFFPALKYSVVTGFFAVTERLGFTTWVVLVLFIVLFSLRRKRTDVHVHSVSQHTYGFFNKYAVKEEQEFREGSEHWTFVGRVRSCLAFGLIHMVNLIYPLSTILPLAMAGGVVMFVYLRTYRKHTSSRRLVLGTMHIRRDAVLESSIWHRVYNRIALAAFAVSLLLWAGLSVYTVFALSALALPLSLGAESYLNTRKARSAESAPSPAAVGTPL